MMETLRQRIAMDQRDSAETHFYWNLDVNRVTFWRRIVLAPSDRIARGLAAPEASAREEGRPW